MEPPKEVQLSDEVVFVFVLLLLLQDILKLHLLIRSEVGWQNQHAQPPTRRNLSIVNELSKDHTPGVGIQQLAATRDDARRRLAVREAGAKAVELSVTL